MLKNDRWIKEQAAAGMIKPFEPGLVREIHESPRGLMDMPRSVLSYGCSSYGYDLRLSPKEFKIFRHIPGTVINPKAFNADNLEDACICESHRYGRHIILPAHSYGLGVTLDRLRIPPNITCIFLGKSTYARCGVIVNTTPGEAGWEGHLTLEISNSSPADCMIFLDEGIAQALFLEGEPCETTYEDRKGKYQGQSERVITAIV